MNPAGYMTVQVSTDGGATWNDTGFGGVNYNQTVLVSLYDGGGGNDTATNLTVLGYLRPTYVGTTNDLRGQINRIDDPIYYDGRDAVNVETANSLATAVRAGWANDDAQSDVNLNSHDVLYDAVWRGHVEAGQWQLQANHQPVLTADRGTSAGAQPVIETLTVTTNLTFSIQADETPTVQYVTNLTTGVWANLPGQTSYFSNSLYWVQSPIPPGVTDQSYFRAYTSGTNIVSANFTVRGTLTVPTIQVTNLVLSVTSAPPINATSPAVWFAVTNNGVGYKVGGFQ
jgi:hypothetical protein